MHTVKYETHISEWQKVDLALEHSQAMPVGVPQARNDEQINLCVEHVQTTLPSGRRRIDDNDVKAFAQILQ
ncbi:MAG TPA: hypothetical protein V6C72_18940, partial [Chroococcales cyanobacterium]